MKFYKIVLTLFGFSLFAAAVNSMGIFAAPVPNQNLNPSNITIVDLTNTQNQQGTGLFSIITDALDAIWWFGQSIKVVLASIAAVFTLGGTLSSYGIPSPIVAMIMGMITIVAGWFLIQWATGRMGKGME